MPQLDLLTFSIQISVTFFFSWGLFLTFVNFVLPQYLIVNLSQKYLWKYLNNLITRIKLFAYLSYAHLLGALSVMISSYTVKYSFIKAAIEKFTKNILKLFKVKIGYYLILKMFFYKKTFLKLNNNSLSNKNSISTFGQKYKLNFYVKKNSTYTFGQKYLLNFFNVFHKSKRIRRQIMLKEIMQFWTLEDRIFLKYKLDDKGVFKY